MSAECLTKRKDPLQACKWPSPDRRLLSIVLTNMTRTCVCVCVGFTIEKDGSCSRTVGEVEALDEEDEEDEDERGAETEEQSGNESEMNEPEEEVSAEHHDAPQHWGGTT